MMDELNSYAFKGSNFIVWFFRLLISLVATILLLLFVLKINETVSIRKGEIMASSPQTDYKAPFEAQLVRINVKEGQKIKAGDTLVVIQSEAYTSQFLKLNAEITDLQNRVNSIGVLMQEQRKRKDVVAKAGKINAMKYQMDIQRMSKELKALDEQFALQSQRWSAANERYKADSILYHKDMLSKVEYVNTRDAYLSLRENLVNLISQRERQLAEKNLGHINYNKELNELSLSQVQLVENDQAMLQNKSEMESKLIQDKESLKEIQKQLSRQYIIASDTGIVNFVFNTRQTSNLINKGDLLISVAPRSVSYYAKAIIPQREARYVKVGQDTRLKLDAYYQFEQGALKGRVYYMAERKEQDQFYALIQLTGGNHFQLRSGYAFNGEIIIARMTLIRYLLKKLFRQWDKS